MPSLLIILCRSAALSEPDCSSYVFTLNVVRAICQTTKAAAMATRRLLWRQDDGDAGCDRSLSRVPAGAEQVDCVSTRQMSASVTNEINIVSGQNLNP